MRRAVLIVVACVSLVAVACAPKSSSTSAASGGGIRDRCGMHAGDTRRDLYADGELTIGTGNPAYKPWYGGKSVRGFRVEGRRSTPATSTAARGTRRAFAYALAGRLGFTQDQVRGSGSRSQKTFAPGPKDYDFAMQQISYSARSAPRRSISVDGYFDVNQALIANNGSPAIGVTTLAGLKDLKLGAPLGTTSLRSSRKKCSPTHEPTVYADPRPRAQGDEVNGQIDDGVVVDFPTAFYGYADTVVGQFPNLEGQQEQFGLAFAKGNGFVPCAESGDRGACRPTGRSMTSRPNGSRPTRTYRPSRSSARRKGKR